MKHKVSELEGVLLDAAVAKAEGYAEVEVELEPRPLCQVVLPGEDGQDYWTDYHPSAEWERGGPIIERERITVDTHIYDNGPAQCSCWVAAVAIYGMLSINYTPATRRPQLWAGNTPLIAAMRAYVASRFGDEVELP